MSDIRFNSWLHQSGTGGIHQDSAGNIGIGSTQPVSALDVGTGNVNSHNIHSTGIVTATSFVGNVTGDVTANQITVGDTFLKAINQVGLGQTTTASRDAGISTAIGTLIYNTTTNQIEAFGPEGWVNVKKLVPDEGMTATGGLIGDYVDSNVIYRTHTFNSSGTFDVTALSSDYTNAVDVLVVGGGGAGGYSEAGGGGAGGLVYSLSLIHI